MPQCRSCSAEIPEHSRFCLSCGAAVMSASEVPTDAMPLASTPANSFDEGRFPAGTVLAERYRIIGLVGQGGMGEVYRASDLKLGQPVALKFLPAATAKNQQLLARFHTEVRIARQVSHPNVCRVYDIGEVDGFTFLSMEYVDGEDLRSLLRRIGRLPGDKAIEIGRKLCAGLAAAHDKGVLHRDLKPANVMIDGRGQVVITDFGLAVFAGQLGRTHVRDGTPAYMAPEQLAGKEVSLQSDIYALGLVLHEIFTGKRAFPDGADRTTPSSLSSLVKDIDPAVERAILRCLDVDPRRRPASALAVAAALPGGDPIAAALAAGETPTPAMIAASDTEGISIRTCWICLAAILTFLAGIVEVSSKLNLSQRIPFSKPPAVLEQKARDLVQNLGYTDPPADSAHGFLYETSLRDYAQNRQWKFPGYQEILRKGAPPLVSFWYRQSPRSLEKWNYATLESTNLVNLVDPPPRISGMVAVKLDTEGRLYGFDAVPPEFEESSNPQRAPDWAPLQAAAGLDMTRFQSADPQWTPLHPFDARAAWTGSYAYAPDVPIRVEAATWRGRPVFFQIVPPWTTPTHTGPFPLDSPQYQLQYVLLFVLFTSTILLAWRNLSLSRGDLRGAARLGAFYAALPMLSWLFNPHHDETVAELFFETLDMIGASLFLGVITAAAYVALEPHVRRRWPQSMVTWSRLLNGQIRDPLVGSHLLIGITLLTGAGLVNLASSLYGARSGVLPAFPGVQSMETSRMLDHLFYSIRLGIAVALGLFFLLFLLRVLLRREWLAAAAVILVVQFLPIGVQTVVERIAFTVMVGMFLLVTIRFGVLAIAAGLFAVNLLSGIFLAADFSAWYAGSTILVVSVFLVFTAYAFHTAVANRKLFKPDFLAPD
jgi:serine/threonine protein kinase